MSLIQEILEYNHHFVENKKYEEYRTINYPTKKVSIVTCMDPRLLELLPKAMNLKNGDAVLIKTAGGEISKELDSVVRSLLISIYELHVEEIIIVGHHNCGAQHLNAEVFMKRITEQCGVQLYSERMRKELFSGFGDLEESVKRSVNLVRHHPFIPKNIPVHGLIIDPETGEIELIEMDKQKFLSNEAVTNI